MKQSKRIPEKGSLLLSEPFLSDNNFHRSVVLLLEHNDEGSFGFILNKPIELKINELIPDLGDFEANVFIGGPVQQDSVHFLHRIDDLKEDEDRVGENVYWGGDFDRLRMLIHTGQVAPNDVNFYVGYSGWGPGQLNEEMKQKAWIRAHKGAKFTFGHSYDNLWRDILRTMGPKYKVLSNYPENPADN